LSGHFNRHRATDTVACRRFDLQSGLRFASRAGSEVWPAWHSPSVPPRTPHRRCAAFPPESEAAPRDTSVWPTCLGFTRRHWRDDARHPSTDLTWVFAVNLRQECVLLRTFATIVTKIITKTERVKPLKSLENLSRIRRKCVPLPTFAYFGVLLVWDILWVVAGDRLNLDLPASRVPYGRRRAAPGRGANAGAPTCHMTCVEIPGLGNSGLEIAGLENSGLEIPERAAQL